MLKGMNPKTIEVIKNAKQHLNFVKEALDELINNPKNINIKKKAMANILVFGRSVTFVLQNLRSTVGAKEFDSWYFPIQEEMRKDQLLKLMKDARNDLEKKGSFSSHSSIQIRNLSTDDLKKYTDNPPPYAVSFFIGDKYGGSGWEIALPDGTTEHLYVELDDGIAMTVVSKLFLIEPPIYHKGKVVDDTSVENCSLLFYNYLNNLVAKAISKFVIR